MSQHLSVDRLPSGYYLRISSWGRHNDPDRRVRRQITNRRKGRVPKYVCHAQVMARHSDRSQPDHVICDGYSYCSPKDTPNRKLGRYIATGRALKEFDLECGGLD